MKNISIRFRFCFCFATSLRKEKKKKKDISEVGWLKDKKIQMYDQNIESYFLKKRLEQRAPRCQHYGLKMGFTNRF